MAGKMEEKLAGGKSTAEVVKIGNTVLRTVSTHSPFVHELLNLLRQNNFFAAPQFLGIDDKGREILSYIEGTVPKELKYFNNAQLSMAARLIKDFHKATLGSTLAGSCEVICHNDLTPCNTVFVNNMPVAFIDFDAAAPGARIRDLGYAIWQWCDLGNEEISLNQQAERIKVFLVSYGEVELKQLIPTILKRQKELIDFCKIASKTNPYWHEAEKWGRKRMKWLINYKEDLEKLIIYESK